MPELPEVETTIRGLNLVIPQQHIKKMTIFDDRLRWPVEHSIIDEVNNSEIGIVTRRSKYILIPLYRKQQLHGRLMIHLGMSGRLQVVAPSIPREKHSHLDWLLSSGHTLRFTDPRRFGSVHWLIGDASHRLLSQLGPEPLTRDFNAQYLHTISRGRQQTIKVFIMNARIVVGVGNIYASESLFRASIHPLQKAAKLSLEQCQSLVQQIKFTLKKAIKAGGTTLKDFQNSDGKPGYFQQQLNVYGRDGQKCRSCSTNIETIKLGQRATFYCPSCQNHKPL